MLCCLLSPICPTHLRKDNSFKTLPVGKLAEILALYFALFDFLKFRNAKHSTNVKERKVERKQQESVDNYNLSKLCLS